MHDLGGKEPVGAVVKAAWPATDGREVGARSGELGVVPAACGLRASRHEARLTLLAAPEDAGKMVLEARRLGPEITTSNNRAEGELPGG